MEKDINRRRENRRHRARHANNNKLRFDKVKLYFSALEISDKDKLLCSSSRAITCSATTQEQARHELMTAIMLAGGNAGIDFTVDCKSSLKNSFCYTPLSYVAAAFPALVVPMRQLTSEVILEENELSKAFDVTTKEYFRAKNGHALAFGLLKSLGLFAIVAGLFYFF